MRSSSSLPTVLRSSCCRYAACCDRETMSNQLADLGRPVAPPCRVRVPKINVNYLPPRLQQRTLTETHQPLITLWSGDRVSVGNHVARPEEVGRRGKQHRRNLSWPPVPEVALHVWEAENVQAESVHQHRPGIVGDAEITHVDQAIKITWSKQLWVADSLALWPAQNRWLSVSDQLGNNATHPPPALLRCSALAEHLCYQ